MENIKENKDEKMKREGVIITVYVETPSRNHFHLNFDDPMKLKKKKHNNNIIIQTGKYSKSKGYDRKAQLLAYSRDLRNIANSSQSPLTRTKLKKWKWKIRSETPVTRRFLSSRRALERSRSQWRYERVMREERTEVVDQSSCRPRCFHANNGNNKSGSSLFVKLKSLLRGLSKGCKD